MLLFASFTTLQNWKSKEIKSTLKESETTHNGTLLFHFIRPQVFLISVTCLSSARTVCPSTSAHSHPLTGIPASWSPDVTHGSFIAVSWRSLIMLCNKQQTWIIRGSLCLSGRHISPCRNFHVSWNLACVFGATVLAEERLLLNSVSDSVRSFSWYGVRRQGRKG